MTSERADELPGLVTLGETGEPEGEALQAAVQLCCREAASGFHADRPLVARPEGYCDVSRFLVGESSWRVWVPWLCMLFFIFFGFIIVCSTIPDHDTSIYTRAI